MNNENLTQSTTGDNQQADSCFRETRLKYLPISFFAIVMGMTGFLLATEKATTIFDIETGFTLVLLSIILVIFAVIAIAYVTKWIKYPSEVKQELNHPIRISFFPTFSISIILFSVAFLHVNTTVSKTLLIIGMILHLIATLYILSAWIQKDKFQINHFNPSWFIPIVGNILVPIAGVEHLDPEFSWFFFSIGLVFWIILFTVFIYRIVFHNPLPQKLVPTFFILIAPPAIGFVSYVKLVGEVDSFAKILFYVGLFVLLLLLSQFKMFAKVKFFLSSWAYSFPIAAITIASGVMYQQTGGGFYQVLFVALLALLAIFIVALIALTIRAVSRGEICVKEE